MNVKLYHGDDVIIVHPSKVEAMKENGWSEKPPVKKKTQGDK